MKNVAVLLLTNGRRPDTLLATAASAVEHIPRDAVARWLIAEDGRSERSAHWLRSQLPNWEVISILPPRFPLTPIWVGKRRGGLRLQRPGYCHAVRGGVDVALSTEEPWIFWLEDDFVFNEDVDLRAMRATLMANSHVAQMSLKRQPWYDYEIEAGDILKTFPDVVQRDGWVEHRHWFTMNPMLCPRATFAKQIWPGPPDCERRFGDILRRNAGTTFGVWGAVESTPAVTHIGTHRAGTGY